MIKIIPGKFEKGKIIPLHQMGDLSGYQVYITLIPIGNKKELREEEFLMMAKKADQLFKKKKLCEIRSLKELD